MTVAEAITKLQQLPPGDRLWYPIGRSANGGMEYGRVRDVIPWLHWERAGRIILPGDIPGEAPEGVLLTIDVRPEDCALPAVGENATIEGEVILPGEALCLPPPVPEERINNSLAWYIANSFAALPGSQGAYKEYIRRAILRQVPLDKRFVVVCWVVGYETQRILGCDVLPPGMQIVSESPSTPWKAATWRGMQVLYLDTNGLQ